MPVYQEITQGHVPVKIYADTVEETAYQQLLNMSKLPFIHSHIAAMPDVHFGLGATVGSVIPTRAAIIPAAVGVDIGCGMNAVRLSLKAGQLPDNLRGLRSAIEREIPVGFNMHQSDRVPDSTVRALSGGLIRILEKHPKLKPNKAKSYQTWIRQLATLGGGNHFIELCLDENDDVWVMLHTGSRGIGNTIGRYFIEMARLDMEKLEIKLPDRDLAYFNQGTGHFDDYIEAVDWAQDYAMTNRREMMRIIIGVLKRRLPSFKVTREAINCHHNYVARETHFDESVYVTRKGAIRAGAGELGIIPGSMGAKSFIVRGKGNAGSLCSCAHGAGRVMSRNAAKRRFNLADLEDQTHGVECRKDKAVIDEIPSAYKDIDKVMENQSDLVDIVHTLKQVLCIKG